MGIYVGGGITIGTGISFLQPHTPVPSSLFFQNRITDGLTLPSVLNLTSSTSFTIEAFINPTVLNSKNILISDSSGGTHYWYLGIVNNKLQFYFNDGSTEYTTTSSTSIPTDVWTHVALSVLDSNIKLFVNGNVEYITGSEYFTNTTSTTGQLTIGNMSFDGNDGFVGYITNLRINTSGLYNYNFTPYAPLENVTNTVLLMLVYDNAPYVDSSVSASSITKLGSVSVAQSNPSTVPTDYLWSYIDVGRSESYNGSQTYISQIDTTTYALYDLTGNGNFGLMEYNSTVPTYVPEITSSHLTLDPNQTQYINLSSNSNYMPAGNYTKLAWIRINNFGYPNDVISGTYTRLWFDYSNNLKAGNNDNWNTIVDNSTFFQLNKWYCVAVTYGSSGFTLYVNGQATAYNEVSEPMNDNEPLYVGSNGNGSFFSGDIGLSMIFTEALSASQILQVYNSTSNRFNYPIASSSSLYTAPGTYSWICPEGVNHISVLCVGGGGGGSETSHSAAGGDSYFIDNMTCYAQGGPEINASSYNGPPAQFVGDGGAVGGIVDNTNEWPIGGGGAAGYNGQGGTGTTYGTSSATDGTTNSGAGAGGGGTYENTGAGGGGVGLYGVGFTGKRGTLFNNNSDVAGTGLGGQGGSGGSNGGPATSWNGGAGGFYGGGAGSGIDYYDGGNGGALAYKNNISVTPGNSYTVVVGAGGQGQNTGGCGAPGAVRIIWPGDVRQFPNTHAGIDTASLPSISIVSSNLSTNIATGTVTYNITSTGNDTILESGIIVSKPTTLYYSNSTNYCTNATTNTIKYPLLVGNTGTYINCGLPEQTGQSGVHTQYIDASYLFGNSLKVMAYARNSAGVTYSTLIDWNPHP